MIKIFMTNTAFLSVATLGFTIALLSQPALAAQMSCHTRDGMEVKNISIHCAQKTPDIHSDLSRETKRSVVGVGAGALAGAVVAGPVGAVVGGIAGFFIVKHVD